MAPGGSLHGGKYGRVQAIVTIVLDDFSEFDTWCLFRGFNPLEVPGYRFYNAALAWLRDGRDEEGLQNFENALREFDATPHPFHVKVQEDKLPSRQARPRPAQRPLTPEDKEALPIEVVKKQEYAEQGKPFRVPSWWKGEDAAYKSAKSLQGGIASLPKFG